MRAPFLAALFTLAAAAQAQPETVEELQRLLRERDAKIRELSEALEKSAPEEDEELNRALERTLVQQGALLLPAGSYELQPQFSYAHWDKDRGPFRYEWDAGLAFRAGIGREWQIQVGVPYVHLATSSGSASDIGDIGLSIAKQLAREEGGRPAILASAGWIARTGRDGFAGEVP